MPWDVGESAGKTDDVAVGTTIARGAATSRYPRLTGGQERINKVRLSGRLNVT
jgi:hypothetical protein